jgi:hypothetical protein
MWATPPPRTTRKRLLLWHLLPPRLQAGMTNEVSAWLAETTGQLVSSTHGTRPKLTLDAHILQDMAAPERVTVHEPPTAASTPSHHHKQPTTPRPQLQD